MLFQIFLVKLFFSFILSFLFTLYVLPLLISVAFKIKAVDIPDGVIKNHKSATPYLGGVAVYFGFIASLAITFPFENEMFLFLVGSTLLLFVGLIDDLVPMKPHQKIFGQLIATFCFLKAGFYLKQHFFFNNIWNIPFSIFWMLLLINAFNLIDVMDGLTAVVGGSAALSFFVVALYLQHYSLAILLAAFLGALIAFFLYNRPPAKVYLGDAGSLFIGGFFATIPFLFDWGTYNWEIGYITPIIFLAIPLLEVATLILIRLFKGIPFYKPSPDHFSLYLQRNGWSKYQILIYSFIMSLFLFFAAFPFFLKAFCFSVLVILAIIFLSIWFAMLFLKKPWLRG